MGRPKAFSIRKVAVRMVEEQPLLSTEPIDNPQAAIRMAYELLKDYDREVAILINLRADLRPINMSIASIGILDAALVSPREIMKTAILSNAARMMLVHNHVSGSLEPSRHDVAITDKLYRVCELMDIPLLDHIIIGNKKDYYSFQEKKIMPMEGLHLAISMEQIDLKTKVAEVAGNYLRSTEDILEQNDNSFDGIINNLPIRELAMLEEKARESVIEKLKEQIKEKTLSSKKMMQEEVR